eukprot:TRINITY_DN5119_c0_g1_i1.p1 TRINITY_DN5119_c0_g1~~TRINITY_DN5119_c0_g1_i1.p1  ORF type:complete len:374 (-),score=71.52 TRINITY_DN5119_c0_g1_i1:82-1203(-)
MGVSRRKSRLMELTAGDKIVLDVNERLKGLSTKVCTALQRHVPIGATRSIYSIQFVLLTSIAEMEAQHFPMTVTVSLEQGANDVTRGPAPLVSGTRPLFAGVLKNVTMPESKARTFIFKGIAEWFYKCWERIAANEKLGGATGRTFVAEIKVTPPVPGGLYFDLRQGEWKGAGIDIFDEDEKEAAALAAKPAPAHLLVPTPVPAGTPVSTAAVCNNNHPLVPMSREAMLQESDTYEHGYNCDQCKINIPAIGEHEVVLHCAACSYDLCPKCAATRTSVLPAAQPKAPSPAPVAASSPAPAAPSAALTSAAAPAPTPAQAQASAPAPTPAQASAPAPTLTSTPPTLAPAPEPASAPEPNPAPALVLPPITILPQ